MAEIKKVLIADIATEKNFETGDRVKVVVSAIALATAVDLVGINTAQVGATQGFNLSFSIRCPRIKYKNQKYCYIDGVVYEVKSTSKAKNTNYMLLNVAELKDKDILTAFENYLKE